MSNLVDDAVCDYFSLLLNETPVPEPLKAQQEPSASFIDNEALLAQDSELHNVNRQSLELLFANSTKPAEPETETALAQESMIQTVIVKDNIIEEAVEKAADLQAQGTKPLTNADMSSVFSQTAAEFENSADNVASLVISDDIKSSSEPLISTKTLLEQLDEEFQVLFFKVAGLTLAVPLVSLGGIVNIEKLTPLIGRPKWYKGVQQHRGSQLNVVDTCAWVMPEKYDQPLADSVDYQYVVVLEDSAWGLSCEALVDTVTIKKSQINWRTQAGKRPWLAGVVKEQMCGMLNVGALVQMLNAGLGYQDHIEPSLALP